MSEQPQPPRWADRLLEYYCRNELLDSIQGDLKEQFVLDVQKYGKARAKRRYWSNVLTFANRFTLRRDKHQPYRHFTKTAMFRNYTLVTLRNLKRNPVFSLINLVGLAVGLASSMVIFLYAQRELSYDHFHENADNIYRVTSTYERPTATLNWVRTPPALAPAIRDNFPGIGKVSRLRSTDENVFSYEDNAFILEKGFYADSLFLDMFDYRLALGNAETALDEPNSLVISAPLAERFFGDENPLNQVIRFDNRLSLKVTGVFEPLPTNTHLDFEFLISFSTYVVPDGYLADLNSWGWGGFYTFIELQEGIDLANLQQGVTELYEANYTRTDTKVTANLQPLKNLYLDYAYFSNHGDLVKVGSKSTVFSLLAIALLVLIVASLNYMNLSTAISLNRGKEIGMRKVMGAVKSRIKSQFLVESLLLSFISMLLGLGLVWLSQPLFADLLQIELPNTASELLSTLPIFLAVTLLVGLLAGLYPSFVLSAFTPVRALTGRLKTSGAGSRVRSGLTVFQFVVSVVLLSGSFLILRQTRHMQNQSMGFDTENIFVLNVLGVDMNEKYAVLKDALLRNPYVGYVSQSSEQFSGSSSTGPARLQGAPEEENFQLNYYQTGYQFLDLMDLELLQGRFFSQDFPNDPEEALILNETAVAQMELENPLGQRIFFHNRDRVVVGVVRDFNYASLHSPIAPMGIVMPFTGLSTLLIKTQGTDFREILSTMEDDFKAVLPQTPFDIKLLDDDIQRMYEQEVRLSRLVGVFSSLAVILACLGLYGLVTFSVQARLKEVGIRKVLGGSMTTIMLLLSRQFFALILIANLIAWPVVYLLGKDWLSNFSYHLEMDLTLFLVPAAILLLLAVITLSHQVMRAATTNPVNVLRSE